MIKYASFALIALFWVTMNGLLWRSEFGSGNNLGASVPAALVWEKILTSPDDSALSINQQGKRLGYVRIRPGVSDGKAAGQVASENEPEGMVRKVLEYQIGSEGSLMSDAIGRSVRFETEFAVGTDLAWKRLRAAAFIRPSRWEIKANAGERDLWLQSSDGDSEWIQRFEFDELRHPQRLFAHVDSPIAAVLLPQFLNSLSETNSPALSLGLKWEARYEWLRIGQNRVRIYRIEARLFDRHRISVWVSRVGEILRIELPGEIKLINDVLYAS
jgi:hypothetical protein